LDLSFVTVPFPLSFENSLFLKQIDLSYSQLINFDASGSQLHSIVAENVSDRNRFTLINVRSYGEIDLTDGNLGGDLLGSGSTFENPGAVALRADGLKVGGNVFLRGWWDSQGKVNPFTAEGEVRLLAADIKVTIDLSGGTFKNPGAVAVNADRLKVGGAVFLNGAVDNQGKITPFHAEGEVNLVGADIGGSLECDGGTFKNPGAIA
jgi:hypothetical protein